MDLQDKIKEMNRDYEQKQKTEKKKNIKKTVEKVEYIEPSGAKRIGEVVVFAMYALEALFYILGICAAIKFLFWFWRWRYIVDLNRESRIANCAAFWICGEVTTAVADTNVYGLEMI